MSVKRIFKVVVALVVVMLTVVSRAFGQTDITADFTDDKFRAEVYRHIGQSDGTPIYDTTVAKVRTLSIHTRGIYNLTGIHHFVGLIELSCSSNWITTLDVSMLTKLDTLYCNHNQLTSLNISGLANLKVLDCSGNKLTSLDISASTNLRVFRFSGNKLTSLDISGLANLTHLECSGNNLTSLDISELTKLTLLWCGYNQLTSLDVLRLVNLDTLWCNDNQLTSLDVSTLTNLKSLWCQENNMASEDAVIGFTNEWGTDKNSAFRFSPQNNVSVLHRTVFGSSSSVFRLSPAIQSGGSVAVRYSLNAAAPVTLSVYNLRGKRVAYLPTNMRSSGNHSFTFRASRGFYIVEACVVVKSGETKFTERFFVQ